VEATTAQLAVSYRSCTEVVEHRGLIRPDGCPGARPRTTLQLAREQDQHDAGRYNVDVGQTEAGASQASRTLAFVGGRWWDADCCRRRHGDYNHVVDDVVATDDRCAAASRHCYHSVVSRRRVSPASYLPRDCTALSANYIRPSGFRCCGPDGLELTTD